MIDPTSLAATAIAERVRSGAVTARSVAEAHIARIDSLDGKVGAFTAVTRARRWGRSPACPMR